MDRNEVEENWGDCRKVAQAEDEEDDFGGGLAGGSGASTGRGGAGGGVGVSGGGIEKKTKPPRKRHQRALNNSKEMLAKISAKSVVVMQLSEAYTAEHSFLVNENVRIRRENELLRRQIAILGSHRDGSAQLPAADGFGQAQTPQDKLGDQMEQVAAARHSFDGDNSSAVAEGQENGQPQLARS